MNDGSGVAEALLGLAGFRVLAVNEADCEVVIDIETTVEIVGCRSCGSRAEAQDRMPVAIRDLACFGRPARLVWNKKRWRCVEVDCDGSRRWPPIWPSPIGRGLDDSHLAGATRVADPFHVVRVANRCVDKVRRRVQNETLHHRGRKHDPLYRIRKLLLSGGERLDDRGSDRMLLGLRVGDPDDEVLGAWLAKESVRDIYLTDDPADAALLIDKAIAGCAADDVEEIRSLGKTLAPWRSEILEHHNTGASNGPTEGLNLCVKKVKRCGHGFRSFEHYRLRVLLHAGGVTWPRRPSPPRIRTRAPHSVA